MDDHEASQWKSRVVKRVYLNDVHLLIKSLLLAQGDTGPLGEMGLPGPNGLKVMPQTHLTQQDAVCSKQFFNSHDAVVVG